MESSRLTQDLTQTSSSRKVKISILDHPILQRSKFFTTFFDLGLTGTLNDVSLLFSHHNPELVQEYLELDEEKIKALGKLPLSPQFFLSFLEISHIFEDFSIFRSLTREFEKRSDLEFYLGRVKVSFGLRMELFSHFSFRHELIPSDLWNRPSFLDLWYENNKEVTDIRNYSEFSPLALLSKEMNSTFLKNFLKEDYNPGFFYDREIGNHFTNLISRFENNHMLQGITLMIKFIRDRLIWCLNPENGGINYCYRTLPYNKHEDMFYDIYYHDEGEVYFSYKTLDIDFKNNFQIDFQDNMNGIQKLLIEVRNNYLYQIIDIRDDVTYSQIQNSNGLMITQNEHRTVHGPSFIYYLDYPSFFLYPLTVLEHQGSEQNFHKELVRRSWSLHPFLLEQIQNGISSYRTRFGINFEFHVNQPKDVFQNSSSVNNMISLVLNDQRFDYSFRERRLRVFKHITSEKILDINCLTSGIVGEWKIKAYSNGRLESFELQREALSDDEITSVCFYQNGEIKSFQNGYLYFLFNGNGKLIQVDEQIDEQTCFSLDRRKFAPRPFIIRPDGRQLFNFSEKENKYEYRTDDFEKEIFLQSNGFLQSEKTSYPKLFYERMIEYYPSGLTKSIRCWDYNQLVYEENYSEDGLIEKVYNPFPFIQTTITNNLSSSKETDPFSETITDYRNPFLPLPEGYKYIYTSPI